MTADSPVASDWYQTFFTAPVMRFWEAAVPQQATDSEVAFILRHIGAHAPATLLDVPCGAGRHLLALAREGLTVTGVDLSQAALSRAEELAQSAGVRARLVRSDMTELEVNQAHDARGHY